MDITLFPALQNYINNRLADAECDERAQMENFLLEERPSAEGQRIYDSHLGAKPLSDLYACQKRHNRIFVKTEIEIGSTDPRRPLTFRPENDGNRLPSVGPNIHLVRLEDAIWPCGLLADASPEKIQQLIEYRDKGGDAALSAIAYLQRLADEWNRQRDQRPQYATTFIEVDDILQDGGPDWADRLRDRLGIGDLQVGEDGKPVPVFLMRYTVAEASTIWDGQGHPAVPTLLDGKLSAFFYPTPIPAPDCREAVYGHTLNLNFTKIDPKKGYSMGVELLHPRFDYKPEHFYRVGYIKNSVSLSLEEGRRLHLPRLQERYGRSDFGAKL